MTAEHSEADWLSRAVPADPARPQDGPARPAIGVLADRLAAALVHHEPGWRLPRHTALARRYNVSPAEIETAIGELVSRHLVRRLADGQLYRASPAEYLIEIEGVSGLASSLDPMGGDIACRSRQVSWRRVPEDIGWALGLETAPPRGATPRTPQHETGPPRGATPRTPQQETGPPRGATTPRQHETVPPPGATPRTPQHETSDAVCVVRFLWTANGEPAACTTTYLPADRAAPGAVEPGVPLPDALTLLPLSVRSRDTSPEAADPAAGGRPGALHIEMQPPPPAVARSLRLPAGQPATIVTVRFDDPSDGTPVALTVAVLRSDLFRVALQSPQPPLADDGDGTFTGAWTHAVEDWEP